MLHVVDIVLQGVTVCFAVMLPGIEECYMPLHGVLIPCSRV